MMSVKHYTDEELADYAFDPRAFTEKSEVEAHVAACSECRARLSFIEKFDSALREEFPWLISDDLRSETSPAIPELLQRRARVLDQEMTAAREVLAPVLVSPLRFRNARIEEHPDVQSAGAVKVLYEMARELTERQPQFALLAANAAVAIASRLMRAGVLRSKLILGRAYLERGRTLFLIGRYRDAEESLAQAERAYDDDKDTTGWDLASVWLIRANICVESERMKEARFLAVGAARQFRAFGDTRLYLNARLLLASIHFMEGDYRASAEAAEEIVRVTRAGRDSLLLGRALQNCGEAYLMLKEYDRALPRYLEAYAIWDELELEAERVRTNWSLATLDVAKGLLDDGIRRLDETYRAFEALGVSNDAALARLQLAETLLLADRPATVPAILADVVVNFASEGMMRNAQVALAYLHEAMAQNRLNADIVRHVRTYLEQLPLQPSVLFAPRQ